MIGYSEERNTSCSWCSRTPNSVEVPACQICREFAASQSDDGRRRDDPEDGHGVRFSYYIIWGISLSVQAVIGAQFSLTVLVRLSALRQGWTSPMSVKIAGTFVGFRDTRRFVTP